MRATGFCFPKAGEIVLIRADVFRSASYATDLDPQRPQAHKQNAWRLFSFDFSTWFFFSSYSLTLCFCVSVPLFLISANTLARTARSRKTENPGLPSSGTRGLHLSRLAATPEYPASSVRRQSVAIR